MALPLVLHELADAEALAAYDWYAARDLTAAEKFRSTLLEVAIMHLHRQPDYWRGR